MTLEQLKQIKIPFGKYKNKPLGEVNDLKYLNWMLGIAKEPFKSRLRSYLCHPQIEAQVNDVLDR